MPRRVASRRRDQSWVHSNDLPQEIWTSHGQTELPTAPIFLEPSVIQPNLHLS